MKNSFLKTKLILIIVSFLTFIACNNDDDSELQSPTISYQTNTLEATFFKAGNSSAPTINWYGNQGNVFIVNPLAGLSINTSTGVLNWTKDLPIGTHNIEVIATNSNGQIITSLIINNPFQGRFVSGTFDTYFEIDFNTDGTLILYSDHEDNVLNTTGTGTWVKNDNLITIDYTYSIPYEDQSEFSLSGVLNTETDAVYSGLWHIDHGAINGNVRGTFEVILE